MKRISNLSLVRAFAALAFAAANALSASAQDTNPVPGTNEPDIRDVIVSNVLEQAMAPEANDAASSNNPALTNDSGPGTNNIGQTNVAPATGRDSQRDSSQYGDSRSSRRRSGRESSSQSRSSRTDSQRDSTAPSPTATPGSASARPDFSAFRIIAERNIFDPNRRGSRSNGTRERPRAVDSIGLVGVMSYEKGTFAFFDGSSSSYRKALKQNDSIAGYRLESINGDQVRLAEGTNHFELRVGNQLRREDGGPWRLSRQSESFAASGSPASTTSTSSSTTTISTSNPTAASSGDESDVLRRLRERRERE